MFERRKVSVEWRSAKEFWVAQEESGRSSNFQIPTNCSKLIVMLQVWKLVLCLAKRVSLLLSLVRNWMNARKSILLMIKNSMPLFVPWIIGVIISFQVSFYFILIMKLWSVWIVSRNLIVDMPDGLNFFNPRLFLSNTSLESWIKW